MDRIIKNTSRAEFFTFALNLKIGIQTLFEYDLKIENKIENKKKEIENGR
jgi:hypothetical protein